MEPLPCNNRCFSSHTYQWAVNAAFKVTSIRGWAIGNKVRASSKPNKLLYKLYGHFVLDFEGAGLYLMISYVVHALAGFFCI